MALVAGLALGFTPAERGSKEEASPQREQPRQILETARVQGGLVVHVGCGEDKPAG